jgi:hypothetical protein
LSLLWADFCGEENGLIGPLSIELPSSEEFEVLFVSIFLGLQSSSVFEYSPFIPIPSELFV